MIMFLFWVTETALLKEGIKKIIEEAPSGIPDKVKKQMHEVSKELCKAIGYRGAGTIEIFISR